ncbi:hypothetical protein MDMS009_539 [Methylophaga thiooxydans DMS010]|uniref:Uncharacterized protein n=1 Tax=Methylophaga thiooxydans DMS010 TaxID=637616 RepID=C0N2Z6_9GAMM|nr:hypothetical protein MDMS009_539 [Methylophaga thiooxydans DMS010]
MHSQTKNIGFSVQLATSKWCFASLTTMLMTVFLLIRN